MNSTVLTPAVPCLRAFAGTYRALRRRPPFFQSMPGRMPPHTEEAQQAAIVPTLVKTFHGPPDYGSTKQCPPPLRR